MLPRRARALLAARAGSGADLPQRLRERITRRRDAAAELRLLGAAVAQGRGLPAGLLAPPEPRQRGGEVVAGLEEPGRDVAGAAVEVGGAGEVAVEQGEVAERVPGAAVPRLELLAARARSGLASSSRPAIASRVPRL